ncbi:MAG TPA: gamma-glutamyltransferase [Planctomycetota bacterium]|nr:gamma-glutamyltransferase [Planctomycetota bacterium]
MRTAAFLSLVLFLGCKSAPTIIPGPVHGAVAAPERHAKDAGEDVLRDGGNAVDAAVCMAFVLAVTHPEAGNLGGGTLMVVHTPTEDFAVDAREVATRAARTGLYLDADGKPKPDATLVGPLAAGVPGTVAGLLLLHERAGKLPRERILAPAIELADGGFRVDAGLHDSLAKHRDLLSKFPETASIFLPDGQVPDAGYRLQQPELANALREISANGTQGFYRGWMAQRIQEVSEKYGGNITIGDLYTYEAKIRAPIKGSYRGLEVLTMPPPSSGGVCVLQILDLLERGGYDWMRPEQRAHLLVEAERRAFADRALYFGDPDAVEVPVVELLDPNYLQSRFVTIHMTEATPSAQVKGGLPTAESAQTCHLSVADEQGYAVSLTTTLNGAYGCGVSVSGVLLNNEMDDFTLLPGVPNQFGLIQGESNLLAAGRRPLSSMSPTIVLKDGQVDLVVGSPGGPTIISVVAEVIANRYAAGMSLEAAIRAPRRHCQWMPDEVLAEPLPPDVARALDDLGHHVRIKKEPMGDVQAVGRNPMGRLHGVSDPRGRGAATR